MDIATLGIAVDSREVKVATADLNRLTEYARRTAEATEKLTEKTKDQERATGGLASSYKLLGSALASLSLGLVVSKFVEAERATGILNVQLKTATGSAGAASAKFTELNALATRLPSSLQDVTQAFVKLKNLGLDPSERAIISYSNTAAAMGKTLNDMIEAVADASTGEFERLKEFGIRAKTQGDQIQFTFQGVTTSVKNNAQSITEYLTRIGEVNFAGAATERMNTLDGAISNLEDSFDSLLRTINSGGFGTVLADGVRVFTGALQDAEKVVKAMNSAQGSLNQTATVGAAIQRGFGVIFETVATLGANVAYVFRGIGSEIGGIAAQLAALGRGDVAGAARIGEAIREDAVKARQEVDRLTASILGARTATATPAELQQQFRASERAYGTQTEQQKTLTAETKKATEAKKKQRTATQEAASDLPTVGEQYQRFIAQQVLMAQETERATQALGAQRSAAATDALRLIGGTPGGMQQAAQIGLLQIEEAQKLKVIQDARAAEVLTEQEAANAILAIRRDTANQITDLQAGAMQLQLAGAAELSDGLLSITRATAGEQSSLYKGMFAVSKAFAIADSLVQISAGVAKAANNPWPLNLAAMASVATAGASIVSNIQAVQGAGFKSGGYTGDIGTSDVAGVVHGREFVMNAAATAANRPALEAMNRGQSAGTQVVIENYAPGVVVEQVDESRFRVIATEEANRAISNRAPEVIAADMANPNGRTSKSMAQNFNLSRRRA